MSAVPALGDRLAEVRIRGAWSVLVGPDAARRSRPVSLANGCLHVAVDNSPWLQELTLRSGELTTRLAAQFEAIRTLRFTLAPLPDLPSETSAPTTRRPAPPLTAADVAALDATVATIGDAEVRAAVRRLLGRARRSDLP